MKSYRYEARNVGLEAFYETNNKHRLQTWISVLAAMLLALLLVAGCDRDREEEKSPTVAAEGEQAGFAGTIVAVGDSLTAGLGVAEESGYPAQLQRRLQAEGQNYQVINAGVSGETTSGTLSRLDWILTLKPDIVILEIGANDGLRGIDPAVPMKNIREILSVLSENDIVTVFTGMRMVWNLGPIYTASFNAIYPRLADEFEVIFMPFFLEDVATVQGLNNEDGLHPNGRGYEVVVENLYPYVQKAIAESEKRRGRQ